MTHIVLHTGDFSRTQPVLVPIDGLVAAVEPLPEYKKPSVSDVDSFRLHDCEYSYSHTRYRWSRIESSGARSEVSDEEVKAAWDVFLTPKDAELRVAWNDVHSARACISYTTCQMTLLVHETVEQIAGMLNATR